MRAQRLSNACRILHHNSIPASLTLPHRSFSQLPAVHTPAGASDASSLLSPAVMFLVRSEHVDPSSIKGSGRAGRLLKADVLSALHAGTAKRLSPSQHPSSSSSSPSPSTPSSSPSPSSQQGPRITESGRRNRSAMFHPQFKAPTPPPSTKMQAIDVPSKSTLPPSTPPPKAPTPSPTPFRGRARRHEDVPLTNIRKVIATRLLQSKQTIPHSYVSASVDMTAANALRAAFKAQGQASPSVNDLIVRASALALRRHPTVNATMGRDGGGYTPSPTVDVCVAVATPTGLLTPIVARADRLRLGDVSAQVRELAGRAKAGRLKPEEFQGGSFTISNLGMYGVSSFAAIINPPQACILAVGGNTEVARVGAGAGVGVGVAGMGGEGEHQAPPVYVPKVAAPSPTYAGTGVGAAVGAAGGVVDPGVADVGESGTGAGSSVSVSPMMGLTLVFDERAIDGEEGSKFLSTLKTLLEAPESML